MSIDLYDKFYYNLVMSHLQVCFDFTLILRFFQKPFLFGIALLGLFWLHCGEQLDPYPEIHFTLEQAFFSDQVLGQGTDQGGLTSQAFYIVPQEPTNLFLIVKSDTLTQESFTPSCEWVDLPTNASEIQCDLITTPEFGYDISGNTLTFQSTQARYLHVRLQTKPFVPTDVYHLRITFQGMIHSQSFDFPVQVGAFAVGHSLAWWGRQLNSQGAGTDEVKSLQVDSQGAIYVAFNSTGSLQDHPNQGDFDAFLIKYQPNGALSWILQLGTSKTDRISSLVVDASGRISVVGTTYGSFPEQTALGGADVFVAQISPTGRLLWLHQLGTSALDQGNAIAVSESGTLYIAGNTEGTFPGNTSFGQTDAFVASLDENGKVQFIQTIGTDQDDQGTSIAIDTNGHFYLGGTTQGTFPGQALGQQTDLFLVQGNNMGKINWIKQIGSIGDDNLGALAVQGDAIYGAGSARGNFPIGQEQTEKNQNQGGMDALLLKWKLDGSLRYAKQIGTAYKDQFTSLYVGTDTIWAAGSTRGEFPGNTQTATEDVLIITTNLAGNPSNVAQFGTDQVNISNGLAIFGNSIYIGGTTFGIFPYLQQEYPKTTNDSDGFLFRLKLPSSL